MRGVLKQGTMKKKTGSKRWCNGSSSIATYQAQSKARTDFEADYSVRWTHMSLRLKCLVAAQRSVLKFEMLMI